MDVLRIPTPSLVVLVGPSGAGKSHWAESQFRPEQIVSSDRLRGVVGHHEHDQRASKDAFEVLDLIVDKRLKRKLTTVIDTLALDAARRRRYLELARRHGVACVAVAFDTPARDCRARNKARVRPVPAAVLTSQLETWGTVRDALAGEGFDAVHAPGEVRLVAPDMIDAPAAARRQREEPMTLEFGLQIPRFTWEGGPAEIGPRLAAIAEAAERAGLSSVWVMDHFLQIPQVGPEWLDMLDSYTTLGFIAARTSQVRLGTMVTGLTYRNVAHLAKIVATLDVLSGGRAVCGIGAAWFEREHRAYGWEFPPLARRYELLEDALQVLPLLWGPGSPSFAGKAVAVPEAIGYPRPLQEKVPILVGGSGERKTLRLVAQYADACNLFGDAATVQHKLGVLRSHCADVGRDPAEVKVTHLSTALTAADAAGVAAAVEAGTPRSMTAEAYAALVNAGTIEDHVGRFRTLAEAGVQEAIVNLPDLGDTTPVDRFAEVIAAFR